MICSKCGKEFEGRFCPWCGAASEESEKASATDKIAEEEALKVEEMPKAETPKAETPKVEAPVEETPKEEMLKAEEEKKIAEQAATEEKAEGSASAGKIKCPKCGNVFSGKFCPECGYKAAELDKCPVCGAPHKAGDKFCAECGYSYEKKPNAAAATVAGIGTAIKNSCKNALAFCKKHSKKVIATAVAVALILVIVVPISVVFTSPVQPANVDRIKIGDTQERVLSILGDPYDWKEGDTTFEYYSDNYLKIKKELDKISNMEDMESFGDFADALEKEEELNTKLETLEYKETTISFDEDGLVTKVVYNACVSESEEQAKEIKSKEVLTESIRVYEKSEVVYTIKYTDKSIVKAIAQVTPDMLLDEYAFSIYDPFAPENKIELSCKVVENSDVATTSAGNCQYRLDQYGKLTISGTGTVTKEGINRLSESSIKEVIIEEGVTGIGEGAFASCGSMTSVSIPDSVTSVGKDAFANTSVGYTANDGVRYLGNETNKYLVAMQIGTADTIQFNIHGNCRVIADSAFEGNETLKAVYIPEGSVKYIGARAFYGCTLITGVTLGNGVENIGDAAFCGCDSLTSITIPGSVINVGASAFSGCETLANITIGEGVTSIGDYAFDSCFELQNISIPSSLETVGNRIFNYVNKVTRIDFDGDLAAWLKVMSLGGMASVINSDSMIYFNGEQLSGDIVIPEGITSIPSYAFTNFTQITSLTIPDSVTSIGSYILQGCTGIESLIIPNMTRRLGGYFGEDPRYDSYNTQVPDSLKTLVITGGESIPQLAFSGCSSLTSITIPDSVTSIGSSAFSGCSSLTSITIPDSVTSIGSSAFSGCSSLTSITIPDSVTSIGNNAFYGVDISYTITYVLNGGTNVSANPQMVYLNDFSDNAVITLSAPIPGVYTANANGTITYSEVGEFLGWYKDGNFTEKVEELTLNTGDITLYAKWLEQSAEVTANYVRVNENNVPDENGGYILFGQYPQKIKAAGVTVGDTADEDGYYLGSDGARYAKVTADPDNSGYKFSDNTSVISGNTYYFKVEPIRWRILSESDGKAFILCDSIIANHYYHHTTSSTTIDGQTVYTNNYMHSDIRAWLNDEFYNTAFGDLQQTLIQTTEVDNSVESTGYSSNPYACENTFDKIFLPSYREVVNSDYGFNDTARCMLTSDYSRAMGAYMNTSSSYYGNGWWWLRSPLYYYSDVALLVSYDGYVYDNDNGIVRYDSYGAVPALNLTLS